jgi:hypothetical protein
VVFIGPNTKLAVEEKLLLSVAHRTLRWCTIQSGAPCSVRLAVGLTPQVTVGAQDFYTEQSGLHTGQSGGLLSTEPPRTSRWAIVPWCIGQSGALDQTVHRSNNLFIGLHLILRMSSF